MKLSEKINRLENVAADFQHLAGEVVSTLVLESNAQRLKETEAGRELMKLAADWLRRLEALDKAYREIYNS